MAVVPVGLWGTHRMMMKGRKPEWKWRIAEVAVVGEPVEMKPGEHVKDTTTAHHGRDRCGVARAREIYPDRPGAGEDAWWYREPQTARLHQKTAS